MENEQEKVETEITPQNLAEQIIKKKRVITERQRLHLEKSRLKKQEIKIINDVEIKKNKLIQEKIEKEEYQKNYEDGLFEKFMMKINEQKHKQPEKVRDENLFYLF